MAVSPIVLPLPFASAGHASPPPQQDEIVDNRLWLAIAFPRLALEIVDGDNPGRPSVLFERRQGRTVIHTVSALAAEQGIRAGMLLNTAYTLCAGLQVYEYDGHVEAQRLEQIGLWAIQFSAQVSLERPRALLLEIGASLRLFGGWASLQQRIITALHRDWSHAFSTAIAPTAFASLLLARHDQGAVVLKRAALRSALGRLPVFALPLSKRQRRQFRAIGVHDLRDVWRLPRAELTRRFGNRLSHDLDRALGQVADPRPWLQPEPGFRRSITLEGEPCEYPLLLECAIDLLDALGGFLRRRDAVVQSYVMRLYHHRHPATEFRVGLRQATRDVNHLAQLLFEHLRQCQTALPVTAMELYADQFEPHRGDTAVLLREGRSGLSDTFGPDDARLRLLEHLQSRLGRPAVWHMQVHEDHRPEYAARYGEDLVVGELLVSRQRPLWLLACPRALPQRRGRPWCRGVLRMLAGPERIESGWWSEKDVRRDYYVAMDEGGRRLWVYRQLDGGRGWFLHGFFA